MPYFSIILPTYNRACLLPKAIESVLQQTFGDWELIIVDDGSTDDTKAVVEKFQDERIRYIYQENQERSAARNNGINQAKGSYICFLDSDDYFLKDKLANLATLLFPVKLEIDVVYDEVSIEKNGVLTKMKTSEQSKYDSIFEFLMFNSLYSQQLCISKQILQKHQYNRKINNNEDTELWLRISEDYKFFNLSESYQTVIVEHTSRSINLLSDTQINDVLNLYNHIFTKTRPGIQASTKTKKKIFGSLYFNIAKIKMQQSKKYDSIVWLVKSLVSNPKSKLNKHVLYCLFNLFMGKIPKQYEPKVQ